MPNWVHNTLEVRGDAGDLAAFVEAVREDVSDERIRADYDDAARFGEESFDGYAERRRKSRTPLSFDRIAPFDPAVWETTYKTCVLCDGTGTRPDGLERFGADWVEWCNGCNGCHGTGQAVEEEGWMRHHLSEWGTKWDASFQGAMFGMGTAEMDMDASVGAQGATVTPTVAVYKFDTAWSAPYEAIRRASEAYPSLELLLQYGDLGGDSAGRIRYVSGLEVESEELDPADVLMPEEMWF